MAHAPLSAEQGEAARKAALGVPGVAGLYGGRVGEIALLLPGERIEGLRPAHRDNGSEDAGVEMHIVLDVSADRTVTDVASDVRSAVLDATDVAFVDVVVADAVSGS